MKRIAARSKRSSLEKVRVAHVFTPSAKASRVKGLEEQISKRQFWYRSYDPRVMKAYGMGPDYIPFSLLSLSFFFPFPFFFSFFSRVAREKNRP